MNVNDKVMKSLSKEHTVNCPAISWTGRGMGIPELVEIKKSPIGHKKTIPGSASTNPIQQSFSKTERCLL